MNIVVPGMFFVLGVFAGGFLVRWVIRLVPIPPSESSPELVQEGRSPLWLRIPVVGFALSGERVIYRGEPAARWWLVTEVGTGLLFAALAVAYLSFGCQQTPEVRPEEFWRIGRLFYQLILLSLLIAATGTDFRDYTIPDAITIPGMLIGLGGATLSGQLQIAHLWIDWNQEIPGMRGPFFPSWIAEYQHLHGLAWSLAGLLAGAGITWLVRGLSSVLLGRDAMGFGDVTLMAMIGSFLGWQPVVLVFLLAPLCGMAVSISVRLFTGRTFIPYGPYLGAAAFLVLVSWRWIWMFEVPWSAGQSFSIRRLFGDWQSLLIVAGIALAALVVQLVFIRMFQAIPVGSRTQTGTAEAAETVDTSQPASGIDTDDPQKRDESNTIQD